MIALCGDDADDTDDDINDEPLNMLLILIIQRNTKIIPRHTIFIKTTTSETLAIVLCDDDTDDVDGTK